MGVMATAYLLIHSGMENPSRELTGDELLGAIERFDRATAAGPDPNLRTFGRGGVGISLDGTHYVIVRRGIIAVFASSGVPDCYPDSVGLEVYLRGCLTDLELIVGDVSE